MSSNSKEYKARPLSGSRNSIQCSEDIRVEDPYEQIKGYKREWEEKAAAGAELRLLLPEQ